MADWSPKDLDKLFQDGSEQHDFPYNPDAWNQMEVLLEKDKKRRFFWWILGATGIFLLLFIGWGQFHNQASSISENSKTIIATKETKHDDKNINKTIKTDSTWNITKSTHSNTKNQWEHHGRGRITMPEQDVIYFPAITTTNSIKSSKKSAPINIIQKDIAQPISTQSIKTKSEMVNPIQKIDAIVINTIAGLSIQKLDIATKEINPIIKALPKKKNNHFHFGIVLGADGAAVHATDFSKINWKFGIQSEYRLGKKYSIGLGLTYTQKKYQANKGDYTPPLGFWTRKIAPEYTQAECNILEIPMTFHYFHSGYMNSGFYTNIGATSYFMMKERYNYFYDLPDADLRRQWGTENENFHLFSMAQIGFGYQLVNGHGHSLRLGSFGQIPLRGIGHGGVRVFSFGVLVGFGF